MRLVRKNKNICRIKAVLFIIFLFIYGYPSICSATGIKDKKSILTNPQKKYINHFFNASEFYRKGELDKALDEYLKAFEYDPSNMMILNSIGRIYWKMGKLEKAVAIFRKALRQSDDRNTEARARSSLGIIYMDQGKYKKALAELQLSQDLDPESSRKMSYKTIINKCRAELD